MPTPLEALMMSTLTYEFNHQSLINFPSLERQKLESIFQVNYPTNKPIEWNTKEGAVRYLSQRKWKCCDFKNDEATGYQCVVFINSKKNEIVLAHRGTITDLSEQCIANIKNDIEILKGEKVNLNQGLNNLISQLVSFITHVFRIAKKNLNYKFFQVGHSLGGFLAEVGAAYIANPTPLPEDNSALNNTDEFQYKYRLHTPRPEQANCITFDSLGSLNVLEKLNIPAGKSNSTHYFLKPNFANTANLHDGVRYILLKLNDIGNFSCSIYGNAFNLIFLNHRNDAIRNFNDLLQDLEHHSLTSMIEFFSIRTGEPINKQHIQNWYRAINSFSTVNLTLPNTQGVSMGQQIISILKFSAYFLCEELAGINSLTHIRYGRLEYGNTQIDNTLNYR